ncbi:MAG TPA: TlpA disulfide reductase family protein [Terriglobales bacterium]|nr:TlpA disulfide reductase family protein [Terriglobales bacterium]
MKYSSFATTLVVVLLTPLVAINAQTVPAASSFSGLELLKLVSRHYKDARSYHLESVEESTSESEYYRDWQKKVLTAAQAPEGRSLYEGRSFSGEALRASDGKTVWTYHANEHTYTAKSASNGSAAPSGVIPEAEFALVEAEELRQRLATLADRYKSATRLPDQLISVGGHMIPCYVVRVETSDLKRREPEISFVRTYWIDKANQTILKIQHHGRNYAAGIVHHLFEEERTTTYTVAELDKPISDSFFTFLPPSDARLIEAFPDPRKHHDGPDLTGQVAPSLPLKSSDGSVLNLESFRGKPVLLDVWATWCPPCVKELAELAKIQAVAKNTNLIFLTVDEDEEAKTATDFLAKQGYNWPNFHDVDAIMSKALGSSSVPQTILIDAKGKIVFDQQRYTQDELRRAIAGLGPEYASLAPKPQQNPCIASK